jgi:hypothetical protein
MILKQSKAACTIALMLLAFSAVAADPWTITTIAGPHPNNGGDISNAQLYRPFSLALDEANGKLYIADRNISMVRVIDLSTLKIDVVAGTNVGRYNGDGIAATSANLFYDFGVGFANGNVYIADSDDNRIRKVDCSGKITTVAGNGVGDFAGDTKQATSASILGPWGVAVTSSGVIYIADTNNNRIRMVDTLGVITTIAGNGQTGYSGDGNAAVDAELNFPQRVAVDSSGNVFIADSWNGALRRIDAITHKINTVYTAPPDGLVMDVALDGGGTIYVATDTQILTLDPTTYAATVLAGDGQSNPGNSVDGVATDTGLSPTGIAVSSGGIVYLSEESYARLRIIQNGTITTLTGGSSGDGGSALVANFVRVIGMKTDIAGNVYLADFHGNRVRKVDTNGVISTFAGTGVNGNLGNGGPATSAQLRLPADIVVDSQNNVYITEVGGNRIRKIDADGNTSLFASSVFSCYALAIDAQDNIYAADTFLHVVYKFASNGARVTIAGKGVAGFSGDGGPATSAMLFNPRGLAVDKDGNVYIVDASNQRLRKVDTQGIITTIAGTGATGYNGDSFPATSATLSEPRSVAVDGAGRIFVTDGNNFRIREIQNGIITTVVGSGQLGFSGDNGPASSAAVDFPWGMSVNPAGTTLIFWDWNRFCCRKVTRPDPGPQAYNGTLSTTEDTAKVGTLVAKDGDADPLTFTIVTNGTKGVATITNAATGAFTYTPNLNVNGTDTFTFKANDGSLDSNTATITVTITPVNDAPVASNGSLTINEDNGGTGALVATDVDNGTLTYSIVTNGTKGTALVTNAATGAYTYTPNANANGTDAFTFKANDGALDSNIASVTVTITPVNDAPVANNGTLTTNEDTAANGTLVATDVDGDALTYSIVANGAKGTAIITNTATGAYTYTPNSNANGSDSFTFKVNDGTVNSNTATITVTITPVNDAPAASNGTLTTNEDTAKTGALNATDVEGSPLTYSVVVNGTKGTAVITNAATGAYTYTPNLNANGTDTFTFKANDGALDSNSATITVTITPVNDAPVANSGTLITNEDTAANGTLIATDVDGDALAYSIVANGAKGTALITNTATGDFTYTPNANANGTDTFTFKANDGALDSNVATITVTITPVNDAPVANDGTLTTNEDTAKTGTLLATDFDSPALTYSIVANGSQGTALITNTATGAYTYTPNLNSNGTDAFTFKANDGALDSNVATITVTITAVNDAPVASDGTVTTNEDAAANGTLAATDVDGDTLTYAIVTNGAKGTALITNAATGAYTYTPNANANGSDTFTFKAKDGIADSNLATVTVTITPVNDAPVASDGMLTTGEDTAKTSTLVAMDVDGDALTFAIVTNGLSGTAVITNAATGAYTYTPNLAASGADFITFKVSDGLVDSNTARIDITIIPDHPAVAATGTLTANEDTPANGTLSATDVDGDPLTYAIATNGSKGTAVVTNATTGAYTYTPNLNANGTDSFTFTANDGFVDSEPATITVTINPVNDAPVASDGTLTTNEDTAKTGTLNATDVDSPTLTYSIVANGGMGTAFITNTATGAYTYTPNLNASGTDTFTFKANDGALDSNTATVTVTITAVNDAPVANDGALATNEDTAKTGTLVATDVDSPTLTYSIVVNGGMGTAFITDTATGAYAYTPNLNASGTDTFTFKANDGALDSNIATITVTITAVNDPPVASDGTLTTNEDTGKTGTLIANDVDGPTLTYSIVVNGGIGTAFITDTATGAYTYTPNANASGTDTFTFKANDGSLDSNTATITVTIVAVNDAPVANDGTLTTNEDTAKTGTLIATDVDGPTLTYSIVVNGGMGTAFVTDTATGAYTYTPNANASGTDTFTFNANDGSLYSNTATITVTITAVNDAPVASDGTLTTNEDTASTGTLVATDVDSQTLTYSIVANGSKGTVVITNAATGAYTYTPNANANGTDTFMFKANDGSADSNIALVTVTITSVNDAPVIVSAASATQNAAEVGTAISFSVTASDVDGDGLTYLWNFGDGSSAGGLPANHVYTSPGTYAALVTVSDPSGAFTTSSVTVVISAPAGPPPTPGDSDGDGFPDAVEIALGSDPLNAASTPFGGAPAGDPEPFTVTQLNIALNFARTNADSLALQASVPVSADFTVLGQRVAFDIGGVVRVFTLDKAGRGKSGADAMQLVVKKGSTSGKLTAKFSKASLSADLADEGLTSQTVTKAQKTVHLILLLDETNFQSDVNLLYTAKIGKTGTARKQ